MSTLLTNRKINLLQATSINMIDMVGIGPFVTMPLVVLNFKDGMFIWAWIFGAVTALIDGLIWSELGAKYPLAGGTYNFHRIAFGEKGGRLMSFLYVWQTSIQAPLVMASAAIGFASHLGYFFPHGGLELWQQKLISGSLIVLVFILLYRRIETIGKISVIMGIIVILTIIWIIIGGMSNQHHTVPFQPSSADTFFSHAFWAAIGYSSSKTVYSYLGYYNVCHLGGEISNPGKNIPRSIFISIFGITALYLMMNLSVFGVMPWSSITEKDDYIVSAFMEQLYGPTGGTIVTILILVIAFSSLFALTLGYSRVPYAAATDDNYFKAFSKLHPTKNFPYVSLIFMCALGFIFSLMFKQRDAIQAILAMRIIIQFISQAVGVVLLRKKFGQENLPFRMYLFPVPVILSIAIWIFILAFTRKFALYGILIAGAGVIVYFARQRFLRGQK